MKFISIFIFCSITFSVASAQSDTITGNGKAVVINKGNKSQSKGYVYETGLSFGGKISTSGWAFTGDLTKRISTEKDRLYYWEVNFLKHPKEEKKINEYSFSNSFDSPKPFVYGKQNSFFAVKAGYGNKYLLGQKAQKNGYEIKLTYVLGPSLGLLKPYYLDVWFEQDGDDFLIAQKYSEETASYFLDATSIFGYSGFSIGFKEISVIPGGFGKAGLIFDWANYDEYIKSLEVGLGADLYIKDIPMMIIENNKPYFAYLYLCLQFGKKW